MTTSPSPQRPLPELDAPNSLWEDEAVEEDFKPLTREEAQQWRERRVPLSVWGVVRWQIGLTVLVTVCAAVGRFEPSVVWSVAYGALCVAVPTALAVYGMTLSSRWRQRALGPVSAPRPTLAGVFVWEGVKILLAVAMMWSAPRWIPDLSWLGLLVGLVVVLKSYWLVLWQRRAQAAR